MSKRKDACSNVVALGYPGRVLKAKAANAGDCRGPGNYSKCAVVLLTIEMFGFFSSSFE